MSVMKDLAYDIEQLFIDGLNVIQISQVLGCDRSLVENWLAEQNCQPFDQWPQPAQARLIADLYDPYNTVNS